jgi:hypothetical protein
MSVQKNRIKHGEIMFGEASRFGTNKSTGGCLTPPNCLLIYSHARDTSLANIRAHSELVNFFYHLQISHHGVRVQDLLFFSVLSPRRWLEFIIR